MRLLDDHCRVYDYLLKRADAVRKEWPKTDPKFSDIAPTTWVELAEKGLIARSHVRNAARYLLTEAGWLAGLETNGALDDEKFRARCVELVQLCKSLIKGRDSEWPVRVYYKDLPGTRRSDGCSTY